MQGRLPLSKGFSLIEILVSLIIVSLTAVNITGLQRKIAGQQRDNINHAAVITIAIKKMEEALSFETADQLMLMNNTSETLNDNDIGDMNVDWAVTEVDNINSLEGGLKEISVTVSWINNNGQTEAFNYSSHINFASLLSTASTVEEVTEIEQISNIISSALNTNDVIYFESNMNYQTGSFVIFDSYLYQATQDYIVGDAYPHSASDPESGATELGEGWQSFGPINNPDLASLEGLITIF